ncbi:MAG: hypothetical protein EHM58_14215 [Ignavibacteriae bacterium]|nr:MAG: hypothetical protein EHM58_14215 [Ignavibacteriota bacterium]
MTKLKQVFLSGTVIFLMTVPVLFSQPVSSIVNYGSKFTPVYSVLPDSLTPLRDTLMKIDTLGKTNKLKTKTFRMKKSPWLAVGLSALIPGAGQMYNQSYWKVPILLGLCGYFGWQVYDNNRQYLDYRDRYAASQTEENEFNGDLNLKTLREFYRNQRDDFIWYFAIVYFVNLVDAYIDAHLFDFDVREEIFTRFGRIDTKYKLNLKINF